MGERTDKTYCINAKSTEVSSSLFCKEIFISLENVHWSIYLEWRAIKYVPYHLFKKKKEWKCQNKWDNMLTIVKVYHCHFEIFYKFEIISKLNF